MPISFSGSRVDLNSSPMDSSTNNPIYEDRVNSVLRKYPKYSTGTDYGGSALGTSQSSANIAGFSSNAVQKSRSYSNFDSLKRTDFSNINTLEQVSHQRTANNLQIIICNITQLRIVHFAV